VASRARFLDLGGNTSRSTAMALIRQAPRHLARAHDQRIERRIS
jgi:hypothetical protein